MFVVLLSTSPPFKCVCPVRHPTEKDAKVDEQRPERASRNVVLVTVWKSSESLLGKKKSKGINTVEVPLSMTLSYNCSLVGSKKKKKATDVHKTSRCEGLQLNEWNQAIMGKGHVYRVPPKPCLDCEV